MADRRRILLPRSDIPNREPTLNEIDFGEIAINTHDGKAFLKRQSNGEVTIETIGSEEVENVYYVSKSGEFGNDGRSLMNSFKTLDSAVATVLTKQGFKFNKDVCERDLQLIMDAIRYDMVLNTNFNAVTAGNAYKRGNAIKVTTDQKYQTRRAINEERVGMISSPLVAQNATATQRIVAGFTELIDIFYDGTPDALYYTNPPIESQTDANAASDLLQSNRQTIIDAVQSYIRTAYINPYDATKCSRDVGLILDAVRRDLITESDYWTTTAGNSYLRANSAYVLSDQQDMTVAAVKFARDQVKALAGVSSDAIIDVLFERVIDVLDGTITEVQSVTTYPLTGTYASTRGLQRDDILAARATLITDTTTFITANYPALVYDSVKCERDTGFLIDALVADLTYDGNTASREAALAYFVGTTSQLGAGEGAATVAAYTDLATRIKALTNVTEDSRVDTLIGITTDAITAGNTDGIPAVSVIRTFANGMIDTEHDAIFDATATIQGDTIDYVDDNWAIFMTNINVPVDATNPTEIADYDEFKCYRDVGLILDAVRRDLITGTNYNVSTAANAYLRANSAYVLSDQKEKTIQGILYARDQIKALAGVTSDSTIDTYFLQITNVLNGYVTEYPTITYPNAGGTFQNSLGGDRVTLVDSIQINRQTLIDYVLAWIDANEPNLTFNEVKCARDTGYIIDGLCHDILYGGNSALITNTKAYFVGTGAADQFGSDNEIPVSSQAYLELVDQITNSIITPQTLDTTLSTELLVLINILRTAISAGNGLDTLPDETDIDTSGLTTTEFNAIDDATLQVQDDTIVYVNSLFRTDAYDAEKCARDVGLIVDAISLEYIARSTAPSRLVALSYRRPQAQEVYGKQRAATLAAVNYLEDLLSGLVDTAGGNELGLIAPFQRIRDGINAGPYTSGVDRSWVNPNTSLYNGTEGGVDNTGSTANTIAAQNALNSFGSGYVSAVLNYVNNTLGVTSFDNQICGEDLLFIINALAYDVDTGTNWSIRQVAESYFSGVVNQLGNDSLEIQTTIAAYEYLKTYITTNLPLDANLAQGTDQTASILAYITNEIDIVINVIKDQTTANMPALVYPSTVGENATDIIGFNTCLANRTALQNQIVDFVNDSNPVSSFDDEKCARDSGLIIDAIALDLQNNTNYNSITSGLAYRRANAQKVQSDQLIYTVRTLNYLRDLLLVGISAESKTFVTARMKEITELLEESSAFGKTDGDPIDYSGESNSTIDERNAKNAILANKVTIKKKVTTFIQTNYDTFEYDPDKCERDVGYILDGLVHDILFGGQYAAETIAQSYWVGKDLNIEGNPNQADNLDGVPDIYTLQLGLDEKDTTVAVYNQLKTIINGYVTTSTEQTRVNNLMTIIVDSISANDSTGIPNTALVFTGDSSLLTTPKQDYIDQAVLFANKIFPTYSYDQAKCQRDVGFILDALTYDLKYGGNSATSIAMRSYFSVFSNGYGDLLGQNEFTMTIAAFKNLKNTILEGQFSAYAEAVRTTKDNLMDIIIKALQQTNAGTFQLGDFFGAERSLDLYQYNYPTGLASGFNTLTFPDLIALGHKVVFNALYLAHQAFNVGESERLTIIRSSNAVANNQGTDTTIFLKSGDYIVNNPIKLPPKTAIIGDALRSTTIRPKNVDSDIFWADNGVYIKEITFRDHQDGAAVLAYDPRVDSPGAGPFITQSPYVQNCTSLTSSGIGLRIDGSKVSGLRSMVLDAFTQFNAGGIGVYLLNRGYSQLVSLFTVSTTTSVLAETGGQCSLTNSNSSFGERGLVARGGSPSLYNGDLHANYVQNDDLIRVNGVITQDSADYTLNIGDYKKPNYNDAIKFDSDNYYYTILDVSDEITQDWGTTGNTTESEIVAQAKNLNAGFGSSVFISADDDYLATGSIGGTTNLAGDVEIAKRDIVGGIPQWDYVQTLVPVPAFGSATSDFKFGTQTVLDGGGTYLAVSAPGQQNVDGASGATQNNGAIYTYRRTGETWTQDAIISLPEVADRSRFFGRSFDMSEDGLWIAASTVNDLSPASQGACYIYQRTAQGSSTWTQLQRITIPDGSGANAGEPEVTINEDGTDLLITWKGQTNKIYYYQKNIDNQYILAQVIVPRINLTSTGRDSKIALAKNTTHFVFGDRNAPRGYFTNSLTDSDNGAQFAYAKKQKLNEASLANSPARLQSNDVDRWFDFTVDFPTDTTITIEGAGANDGDYVITDRTANTLTLAGSFPSPGGFTDVQVYIKNAGVSEYFLFDEGQWVTEDIIEAPYNAPKDFGYGFDIDVNTRGDLVAVGNKPFVSSISNEVSVIERARSDWRRIARLQPQTPTDETTLGNDNFGGSGHATSVGGTGDYIIIGANERRETAADASTEYGASFEYWSILEETGSYELSIAPALNKGLSSLQNVSFHQRSLITASGHTFEYVGSGTNMFTAIPQNGGVPKKENEIQFDSADADTPNFGLVYFTATDERGDFRIGEDLTINREQGNITGVTFDRSLFAVLTPFILALEG